MSHHNLIGQMMEEEVDGGSIPNTKILSPSGLPTGIAFDPVGGNLITCDYGAGEIYIHDGFTDNILDTFSTPGGLCSGLTVMDGDLFSCDYTGGLFRHDGISETIAETIIASSFPDYTGLTNDGTNLILCAYNTKLIYVHDGATSAVDSSFVSPDGARPWGVGFDGINLLSNRYGVKIYKHDGVSASVLDSITPPNSSTTGTVWDGINLISCDATDGYIYFHDGFSEYIET
jgi:hypothetical protein